MPDVIGPGIRLAVDTHQQLTEPGAIRLGRLAERYDLTWLEEPLPAWDLEGVARGISAPGRDDPG